MILGITPCRICGKVMEEGDLLECFATFVHGKNPDLAFFSDTCFHKVCFQSHPQATTVSRIYQQYLDRKGYECYVCKSRISSPDELVPLGFLADEKNKNLHDLNYRVFHLSCFRDWDCKEKTMELMRLESTGRPDLLSTVSFIENKLSQANSTVNPETRAG